jgi:hypothetical protein
LIFEVEFAFFSAFWLSLARNEDICRKLVMAIMGHGRPRAPVGFEARPTVPWVSPDPRLGLTRPMWHFLNIYIYIYIYIYKEFNLIQQK